MSSQEMTGSGRVWIMDGILSTPWQGGEARHPNAKVLVSYQSDSQNSQTALQGQTSRTIATGNDLLSGLNY